MEQKLFDVLLENRKVDEDSNKYSVAFENIEEGFILPVDKEEDDEDTSIEAQANRQFKELYSMVLERFTPDELDYIFNFLIPQEQREMKNRELVERGYEI
jgi:hypothetical protein